MNTMFGAPNGDFCHGLLQPELMGPNRPEPIPIEGLYLGGAGCHGGPGITFIPGYNAGCQVLAEAGRCTSARSRALGAHQRAQVARKAGR